MKKIFLSILFLIVLNMRFGIISFMYGRMDKNKEAIVEVSIQIVNKKI